jgi:phospholipase/carboxylesterase
MIPRPAAAHHSGRLSAAPGSTPARAGAGTRKLGLGVGRDGVLCVPHRALAHRPLPLLVLLHGANGGVGSTAPLLQLFAELSGCALLVPESRGRTWDAVRGPLGPDVAFLDAALALAFASVPTDLARIALAGFSDGASAALTLGLANGDRFTHVAAFAPGFVTALPPAGRPAIFVTHGTRDQILPIDRCSRRIVPALRAAGYAVDYREFDGGHIIAPRQLFAALRWLRGAGRAAARAGEAAAEPPQHER